MQKMSRRLGLLICLALALLIVYSPNLGNAQGTPTSDATPVDAELIAKGEDVFNSTCIACHQAGGVGVPDVPWGPVSMNGFYPALANNPFVALDDPTIVVATVLNGRAGMPSFGSWSDEQVAAVVSYVRQAFGNKAGPVDPELVAKVRADTSVPPLPATPLPSEPGTLQGLGN